MLRYLGQAVGGTIFVFAFLGLLTIVGRFITFDHIDPLSDALRDYESSDIIYNSWTNNPIDTNITIVNIAQVDRATIGKELEIIGKYKPKVVGIDAFFRAEKGPMQDFPLMMGMSKIENLVLVSQLSEHLDTADCWNRLNRSNPMFLEYAQTGFANVITGEHEHGGDFRTVREFRPDYCVADSTELNFTSKIVSIYNPSAFNDLMARGNHSETINWHGNIDYYNVMKNKYTQLDVADVLEERFDPSVIKDKIVLFGYIGEYVGDTTSYIDKFYTPMNSRQAGRAYPDMYGIVVHANVISMILKRDYVTTVPDWGDYLICLLVTFLNVWLFVFVADRRKRWYDVITKPLQILELVLLVGLVIWFLSSASIKMNLTLTLITIAFAGDLTELYHSTVRMFAAKQIQKIKGFIQQ